jgi:hypothetical protein
MKGNVGRDFTPKRKLPGRVISGMSRALQMTKVSTPDRKGVHDLQREGRKIPYVSRR